MSIISVSNLTKVFAGAPAVGGVSFDIPARAIVGLLGGNGAGKTTTLSMLLGIILPTTGTITIMGHNILTHRHRALARMNFSSPYVDLPQRLTVRENLTVFGRLYGVSKLRDRIDELAADLNIAPYLDRLYGSLSAGQKTRVLLAKSLVNSPDVLLLDEPTASLDPDTADWIRTYLLEYHARTGATLLLASHNMPEVERMCHDVIIMKQGIIADRGTPAALLAKYGRQNMEDVFLHIARTTAESAT